MRNWREEILSTDLPKSLFDVKHSNHDSERYLRHDQISKQAFEDFWRKDYPRVLKKLRKLEKEKKERERKEESGIWWKKKLGLLVVLGPLFLGLVTLVTAPEKLEIEKWIEIFEMIFEILRN